MLFSGSIARMVATLALIFFAANQLGVAGFGKYSIIVHYFELLISLSATAACILLTRDAARWKRNRDKLFTAGMVVVSGIAFLAPLALIPLGLAFRYSNDTLLGLAIACFGLVPAAIATLYEAVFVASERAEFITIGTSLECFGRVLLSILLLHFGFGIVEMSCVMVVTRMALAIFYYAMLRKVCDHRLRFCRKTTFRFLKRWRVFAAENWMATIYTTMDVIVLSLVWGEAAVGLYSAAWRYIRLGAVAARSFTTAVFPTLTRLYNESHTAFEQMFKHSFRIMCMISLPVIILVSVIPERVVNLMYRHQYEAAAPILQVLVWMLLLEFINPFMSHILFSQGKQRYSMYVAAVGLATNTLLMFIMVPRLGGVGAAIACVATGVIAALSYLYLSSELRLVATMLFESLRVLIAALVMGGVVGLIPDSSWFVIGPTCLGVYGVMLLVVRAVRIQDFQVLKLKFFPEAIA